MIVLCNIYTSYVFNKTHDITSHGNITIISERQFSGTRRWSREGGGLRVKEHVRDELVVRQTAQQTAGILLRRTFVQYALVDGEMFVLWMRVVSDCEKQWRE